MLNMMGDISGMTAIAINLVAMASVLATSLRRRVVLAGAAGAWIGLATGLGAAGALTFTPGQPVPLIGLMAAAPVIATAACWFWVPGFRDALMALPMPMLIRLDVLRVIGALFLSLAAVGRLSGPFPYSAGLGDIITGVLAIPVARAAERGAGRVGLWNAFGALDLVAAIGLGLASAQGSPLHLIDAGVGSQAMQFLPFSLVPTVLVPFYLITHGVVAAQLADRRRRQRPSGAASEDARFGAHAPNTARN
ncbi:hypothetical protein [Roseiarcus sp.]|uniref:hypothetical protein n=1 Tax=Roseiarcus sp. TaxID=1969460 RepID=UPI003F97E5FC